MNGVSAALAGLLDLVKVMRLSLDALHRVTQRSDEAPVAPTGMPDCFPADAHEADSTTSGRT